MTRPSIREMNCGMALHFLMQVKEVDPSYDENGIPGELAEQYYPRRTELLYMALSFAAGAGWPCGFRIDTTEPSWPVLYIELPDYGQVSWHMPEFGKPYDGHTTEQKYERITQQYAAMA